MKVLLIEDHEVLANNIKEYLELSGYKVTVSGDGQEGLELLLEDEFDVAILDLSLPSLDGTEVCTRARTGGVTIPILILTARTGTEAVVKGLNLGADDYIEKPFVLEELQARVQAAIRRKNNQPDPIVRLGKVMVDTGRKEVNIEDKPVHLSPKEYALTEFLALNKGKSQSRQQILERVWGESDELMFSQTIDVHIAYLRRKLGRDLIRTVPGGYLIP